MSLELLITIFSSVIATITALFVFFKNPKKADNFYFSILAILIGLYSVFNFLAITANDSSSAFVWAKLILVISVPQGVLLLFFASTIKTKKIIYNKKLQISLVIWMLLVYVLAYNNLIFKDVEINDGIVSVVPGLAIPVFVVVHLSTILIGSYKLVREYRSSIGKERIQLRYVTIGLLFSFLLTFLTTLVLPLVFNSTILLAISPLFLTLSVLLTAYAIIAHKLFDIKTAVIRSVVYALSLSFMAFVYGLAIYLTSLVFDVSNSSQNTQLIIYIAVAVVTSLFLQPTKKFFDKLTNKFFYRDSYNTQELIDRLNQTLVTNVNLDELLTKSALIMQEEMKASFTTFYIRETSYFDNRIIGAHRKTPEFESMDEIEECAAKIHTKIFSSESAYDLDNEIKLSKALKKNDVEVMARLTNTVDFEVKGIGYIFMGPKRSGSPYGTNDLKILEIIANELVIAIENVLRFEEIEQFNVTLQKKIDEATKELKQSNDKLRALDEAKDEFVSMASHQLRTPLTSIKGYLSMVLEGDAGEITDTQKKMLGQAFFSSQRMVYLISDLLNVSRLKTGKFVIETKPVYLPDIVASELEQLHEGASAKNLKLSFTKPKTFATMTLDEMKLRQVIMNFTDNAIYYTPSGGKINVELKETNKSIEFTVKDSGIGVPKDQQHKLFTKFYRADNARKARPDGTGLGLFMAKKVIIAQGGSMIFESKEGKGSTFGFSFPKDKLEVKTDKDS